MTAMLNRQSWTHDEWLIETYLGALHRRRTIGAVDAKLRVYDQKYGELKQAIETNPDQSTQVFSLADELRSAGEGLLQGLSTWFAAKRETGGGRRKESATTLERQIHDEMVHLYKFLRLRSVW